MEDHLRRASISVDFLDRDDFTQDRDDFTQDRRDDRWECRILLDSCLLRAFSFWSASMNDVIDSPLKTHFPRDNGIFSGSGIRTCPPRFLILLKRQLPFYYLTIYGKRLIVLKIKRIASILPLVADIVRYS